jgi:hypothetical protein
VHPDQDTTALPRVPEGNKPQGWPAPRDAEPAAAQWAPGLGPTESESPAGDRSGGSGSGLSALGSKLTAAGASAVAAATSAAASAREAAVTAKDAVRSSAESSGSGASSAAGSARPGASNAARTSRAARSTSRQPRKARLTLSHINVYSVFKFSCVLAIALFFVWLIMVGVLYGVLDVAGVLDQVNKAFTRISGSSNPKPVVTGSIVFGAAIIIGAVYIVLFIALSTIGSMIYNLCADLVGGVEVTLSERD